MTRTPFDQFAKQYLEELLTPYGQVEVSREIPGEARLIDLWFNPHPDVTRPPQDLGLLGQIIQNPCLLEPYRNPPDAAELNSCLLKRFWLVADCYRQGQSEPLPQLWILTPTASNTILSNLGAVASPTHPAGVYATPTALGTFIVAIHQLPVIPETLWLRLLGRGRVQQQAIEAVLQLPDSDLRFQTLRLLVNWKIAIDTTNILQTEEEVNFMAWSQALLISFCKNAIVQYAANSKTSFLFQSLKEWVYRNN